MMTESVSVDIAYLEAGLEKSIFRYNKTTEKQALTKICQAINALIQHDDFVQLTDSHCSYHKMRNYWQWRYQRASI